MKPDKDSADHGSTRTLLNSFAAAGAGWRRALGSERNLKIHLAASVLVCGACWFLRPPRTDVCLVVVAVALVWITELLNTAIEHVVDQVSPDYSVLARDAKDISAAAVLTAAAGAVVIGLLVFGPPAADLLAAAFGSR